MDPQSHYKRAKPTYYRFQKHDRQTDSSAAPGVLGLKTYALQVHQDLEVSDRETDSGQALVALRPHQSTQWQIIRMRHDQMFHQVQHSVLESMCRLSVAMRHDASRELLQRTTVLMRRKDGDNCPIHNGNVNHSPDVPIQRTIVPDRSIRGTTVPSRQKDVLSELMCPTRTGYGMSSLDDYGMATGRGQVGSDHVL